MTRLFTTLTIMLISFTVSALECTGINEWIEATSSGEQTHVDQVELQVMVDDSRILQMSADLGDTHFFIQGDKLNNKHLLMITLGPKYEQGVTTLVVWDQESEMRMTRVDGTSVYKLKCH